jgi:hypothetical protein
VTAGAAGAIVVEDRMPAAAEARAQAIDALLADITA